MNSKSLLIQFGAPGEWGQFVLLATWQDAAGALHHDRYTPEQVAASGHAEAMQAVVAAIRGLEEPWQATQVWASLARVGEDGEEPSAEAPVLAPAEYVALRVEALPLSGGRQVFTVADYPAFRLASPEVLAAFNYFTHQSPTV